MTTLGFNAPLYILPFDHRGSFQTKMFGWSGAISPNQTAEIAAIKQLQKLNREFDIADAAVPGFDLGVANTPLAGLLLDAPLEFADLLRELVVCFLVGLAIGSETPALIQMEYLPVILDVRHNGSDTLLLRY